MQRTLYRVGVFNKPIDVQRFLPFFDANPLRREDEYVHVPESIAGRNDEVAILQFNRSLRFIFWNFWQLSGPSADRFGKGYEFTGHDDFLNTRWGSSVVLYRNLNPNHLSSGKGFAETLHRCREPRSFTSNHGISIFQCGIGGFARFNGLFPYHPACTCGHEYEQASQTIIEGGESIGPTPAFRLICGFCIGIGGEIVGIVGIGIAACASSSRRRLIGCTLALVGYCVFLIGLFSLFIDRLPWEWWQWLHDEDKQSQSEIMHSGTIVLQKYLDNLCCCSTVIDMANVLNTDKQIAVIGALAEGSSIRSIERITGVHRDTIMRLGVKVGEGCARVMDETMRELPCNRLEMDEIWGFVGKKDRNVREGEDAVGSVWTFCAIDAETKLVPSFKVGDRDAATAKAFVQDVADRMAYRVQISTDGLNAYVAAMQNAFGEFVDYGQIVKTYGHEEVSDNRRYSAPKFVSCEKRTVIGIPDERLISTSYVERLNATTRLHMRRLTRLTLAFSKKRENFEAAVALHFAYYNFVKRHNTLRVTPAMAAGVTSSFWSVGDLLEAVA